ncbi:MAG: RNA ligase [Candidatus Nanopelagicales bacterium]
MRLNYLIQPDDLARAINDGLVRMQTSDDGMRIFNYTNAAMYTPGSWDNPAVRHCRGLIVGPDDEIVARPWEKFFNHNQPEAGLLVLNAAVEVTDKLDGSLGVLHRDARGEPRVATRGSFESPQALHATELLRWDYSPLWWPLDFTPLVEIVYPENRIVVDYGARDELVLLGGVWTETGEYVGPETAALITGWPGSTAAVFAFRTLKEALEAPPREGMEGMCVRFFAANHIVKIKQEDYLALHRVVTGLNERTVWEYLVADRPVSDLLDNLPDELHTWVREVYDRIQAEADALVVAALAEYAALTKDAPDRKTFALRVVKSPLKAWLFMLYDSRDTRPAILKTLRPVAKPARYYSEDVA